jgi:hypothetical protein
VRIGTCTGGFQLDWPVTAVANNTYFSVLPSETGVGDTYTLAVVSLSFTFPTLTVTILTPGETITMLYRSYQALYWPVTPGSSTDVSVVVPTDAKTLTASATSSSSPPSVSPSVPE